MSYLEQLKNQIRMHIEIRPLNRPFQDNLSVQIISAEELEKRWQNMRKRHSEDIDENTENGNNHKKSGYQLRKTHHDEVPIVKMQPIHPRPPIIKKNGNVIMQKNFLDI